MKFYPKTAQEVLDFFKAEKLPENFCIIPFINMILGPGGDVSVCRQKGTKHIVGSLKEKKLEEIWNGEYLKEWREEFLNGTPRICASEIQDVHCNLSPENYWDLSKNSKFAKVMPYPFKKLTANFNGECNLRCIMCDVWKQENGFYTEENFWKTGRDDIFPFIEEIEMLSGEPFVQEDTFRLMDEVQEINKEVVWSFTTNGFWRLTDRIEKKLLKIRIKKIIFSIDSLIPERYKKIRVNGNLDLVLENLSKIKKIGEKHQSKFIPTIHFLIMKNNYDELVDVLFFVKENKIKLILDICEDPKNVSILSLSDEKKLKIIESTIKDSSWATLRPAVGILLRLVNSMKQEFKKKALFSILSKKSEA